ncbi:hypothetical protein CAPN004_09040 [Capnocytophaga cynodegmi]|uniref:hypothetical protein n=1 Tax=Capnocytophaga cynodegmi TaxID=28189 RepID=UPI001AC046D6|nr:hypothetical protein [Capnocytophaga cynodegmi]GIM51874.1 hypothetical protein CAPN004_09040 [Capnocytophaga cynodegmi]
MNVFNNLGGFVWGVIVFFIALFVSIVWYTFEYWYIFLAIPILLYIIFFISNFKRINEDVNKLIKEVEESKKQNKD